MTLVTPTDVVNHVREPTLIIKIHDNVTVNAVNATVPIYIGDCKHLDLLVYITGETGTASIKYHINVVEASSGKTIRTYDGTELTAGAVTDYITVDGLTTGDYITVNWSTAGTLSGSHYFTGVYARLIGK